MRIILASGSPRRKELLKKAGYEDFEIIVSDVDESTEEQDPFMASEEIALKKGTATKALLSDIWEDTLIISADTTVIAEGEVLGKPKDEEDAFRMLTKLSGKAHQVVTGVALILTDGHNTHTDVFHIVTDVYVKELTEENIREYIASGEPMDKAGAYAIQGLFGRYIERFEGDYDNVVGLPVEALKKHIKAIRKEV